MIDVCTILILLHLNLGDNILYPPEMHPKQVRVIMRKSERCYERMIKNDAPWHMLFT